MRTSLCECSLPFAFFVYSTCGNTNLNSSMSISEEEKRILRENGRHKHFEDQLWRIWWSAFEWRFYRFDGSDDRADHEHGIESWFSHDGRLELRWPIVRRSPDFVESDESMSSKRSLAVDRQSLIWSIVQAFALSKPTIKKENLQSRREISKDVRRWFDKAYEWAIMSLVKLEVTPITSLTTVDICLMARYITHWNIT